MHTENSLQGSFYHREANHIVLERLKQLKEQDWQALQSVTQAKHEINALGVPMGPILSSSQASCQSPRPQSISDISGMALDDEMEAFLSLSLPMPTEQS